MNIAVVGHIEWGRFFRVSHPPNPGEIIRAQQTWEEVAGGGAVAAMQLAQLNGSCVFFTAVGDDILGEKSLLELRASGVEVYAQTVQATSTKTVTTYIDDNNERSAVVVGDLKPSGNDTSLPWNKLAEMDAVYFASGDASALQYARMSKRVISTARISPLLRQRNMPLEALVASEVDAYETYKAGDLSPEPNLIITTQGAKGGYLQDGTRYEAETLSPESIVDFYGCGDSFAAGVTYGLAIGDVHDALNIGAHAGALAAQRRGAFGHGD